MTPPDRFETPRLSARRVNESDLQYVIAVDTDPVMAAWLSGSITSRTESEARLQRWLEEERRTGLGFWIFFSGEEPVGHGGLFTSKRDPGFIELGYAVLPAHWGHGYASEMAHAFLEIARSADIRPIVALTRRTNERSRRVLEKCGLRNAGDLYVDAIDYVRYLADDLQRP
jgi:RimJ/RimL family protein N-acetyltransferase